MLPRCFDLFFIFCFLFVSFMAASIGWGWYSFPQMFSEFSDKKKRLFRICAIILFVCAVIGVLTIYGQ